MLAGDRNKVARWRLKLAKRAILTKHSLESALGSGGLTWRVFFFLSEISVLAFGLMWINPPRGGLIALLLAIVKLSPRIWKGSAPVTLKDLALATKKRSFAVSKLTQDMSRGRAMAIDEMKSFQHRVLEQVASYVRDLRGDTIGRKIFANLLIEKDNESMEVVARSDGRPLYGVVPKPTCIGWRAILSGELECCGDLYGEVPETAPGKKYCSVLAIPVLDHSGGIVGVVTIDSREKHHFDSIHDDVVMHVMPLISMLGWTLGRTPQFHSQRTGQP